MKIIAVVFALLFSAATFAPVPAAGTSWLTFGGSPQRQGYNASETTLGPSTVAGLKLHWSTRLSLGGTLLQPVLAENVMVAGTPRTLLYIAGRRGVLTALDAYTGAKVWSVQLSALQECGEMWRGIGGTPTIDPVASRLYAVDAAGLLHALDLATGTEAPSYPLQVIDPANQAPNAWSHASPTLVGGMLYIAISSMCPDRPPYQGELIAVNTAVPAVLGRYYPLGANGPSGGGIWGPGGAAASADGTLLYTATGNARIKPTNAAGAESVVALDLSLDVLAINGPLTSKGGDFDFASTPLVFQAAGCPSRLVALSKSGGVFLYDPAAISSGPLQTIQVSIPSGTAYLMGIAAFSPDDNAIYFQSGNDAPNGGFRHGLIALSVNAQCELQPMWNQTPSLINSTQPYIPSPVMIANDVAWITYANGADAEMVAYSTDTGAELWRSGSLFPTTTNLGPPLVVNGQVFVGSTDGKVYAFGL